MAYPPTHPLRTHTILTHANARAHAHARTRTHTELVYKNQALYVYVNASEGGGFHWNPVFKRLLSGLIFSHVLFYGYLVSPPGSGDYETRGSTLQYSSINVLGFLDLGFMVGSFASATQPPLNFHQRYLSLSLHSPPGILLLFI